jgi:hypothetical protein
VDIPVVTLVVAGETETDPTEAGDAATMFTLAVPPLPAAEALITAVPTAIADTKPVADTVASLVLDDDHANVVPVMTLPTESRAIAWSCWVFPGFSVTDDGVTLTEAIRTVAAVAVAGTDVVSPPAEALILALPAPTSVTLPVLSTLATWVFAEDQVNVTPLMAWPL